MPKSGPLGTSPYHDVYVVDDYAKLIQRRQVYIDAGQLRVVSVVMRVSPGVYDPGIDHLTTWALYTGDRLQAYSSYTQAHAEHFLRHLHAGARIVDWVRLKTDDPIHQLFDADPVYIEGSTIILTDVHRRTLENNALLLLFQHLDRVLGSG